MLSHKKITNMFKNKPILKQQLLRFLAAGILAVGTDFSSYWILVDLLPVDIAKGISFLSGSLVAFVINRTWTFKQDSPAYSSALPFACLYSLTFLANVGMNHFILNYVADIKLLGFLIATGTSTVLNFIGMKFWVFSGPQNQTDS